MIAALEVHVTETERVVDQLVDVSQQDAGTDGDARSMLSALFADRDHVVIRHELRLEATRDLRYRELHVRNRDAVRRAAAGALHVERRPVSNAAANARAAALEEKSIEAAANYADAAMFAAAMITHLGEVFAK